MIMKTNSRIDRSEYDEEEVKNAHQQREDIKIEQVEEHLEYGKEVCRHVSATLRSCPLLESFDDKSNEFA